MIPGALLNCDLSILAYQLYHQAVLWPVDPWYEVLARGSTSRRTRFMQQAHAYARSLPGRSATDIYSGPASVRGMGESNTSLDPVLTNFMQLRPRDPSWNGDGAVFIGIKTPAYIVNSIRRVFACTYETPWKSAWPHGRATLTQVVQYGGGQDDLIAFEGGTGSVKGTEAAWSPMGYVLKRTRPDGTYDAHIVFRGSRSGNAGRAFFHARDGVFHGPSGNPDWVTDMASKLVRDDYVGGQVAVGFAESLKRCMGTLQHALAWLDERYGPPQTVQVAGHSLGAALASLCVGALTMGTPGVELRRWLRRWPWDDVRGYFFAMPPVGTQDYCAEYNRRTGERTVAPYVAGDPVVECSKSVSLGETGGLGWVGARFGGGGYSNSVLQRMPRPVGARGDENSHEIYLIRSALKRLVGPDVDIPRAVRSATPWATFVSFEDMLEGKAVSLVEGDAPNMVTRANLRETLLNYRFGRHFKGFLHMLQTAVADPKSYRGAHYDATYRLAAERVALALEMCASVDSNDRDVIVDTVATQAAALIAYDVKTERKGWKLKKRPVADGDGVALLADELLGQDFNTRIGLGLILRAIEQKAGTAVEDYARMPELQLCLEVALPDLTKGQTQARALLG